LVARQGLSVAIDKNVTFMKGEREREIEIHGSAAKLRADPKEAELLRAWNET
jgi:hypothetical protein